MTAAAPDRSIEADPRGRGTQPSATATLLAPVRRRLIVACVVQAIAAVAGVVPFIAVAEIGRALLADNPVDTSGSGLGVWWIAGLAVAALALRLICLLGAGALTHFADVDLQLDLRRRMAAHLTQVPLGWFDARSAGLIKTALQDDVKALHHLVGHAYVNLISAATTPIVALAYLFWIDWRLTLIALLPVLGGVVLYALQYRGYGENMAAYTRELGAVNAAAVEFVQGIAVIKTFGRARQAYGRFIERTSAFVEFFWNWMRGLLAISAAAEVILSPLAALLTALAGGLVLVSAGAMAAIDVIPFAVLAPALTAPFLTLAYSQNELMLATKAADRIAELLATKTLPHPGEGRRPVDARVVFDRVSFAYDDRTEVLHEIDLVLEPGTLTALVGPSGSGKSTLARLLPRFWDVGAGSISIGGVDIREMTPETLYRSAAFVFQHVQLLQTTIGENIALGRPDATAAEIEAAARAAQIHDRIAELPRGYASVAGQDARLSGGEAQRISIARAILADAPVLVLDEATAFADPEAEAAIQTALSDLVAGRTVLVIAHRLHTVTEANAICVMDEGRIVERGRHGALLAAGGLYARLWEASEAALTSRAEAAQ
ncbi:MAG: ABC transporter ATP-binding protein [Pseudomonadota bacterium]